MKQARIWLIEYCRINRQIQAVLVTTALLFTLACSSRQVYDFTANTAESSPDAININTASADELTRIPHIGPKTAEAIVRFREENGPFRRREYLMQIRGISEKRFLEMREFLRTE